MGTRPYEPDGEGTPTRAGTETRPYRGHSLLVTRHVSRRLPMGRIAFMTDSTAGMPADQVEKYKVTVVPLQVIFGTDSFRDGIDLTQAEFFARLKAAKTLPTTSQPAVGDFEEAYTRLL